MVNTSISTSIITKVHHCARLRQCYLCLSHTQPYRSLQANYAQLQQKYADLKEKKINDLDSLLEEHSAHLSAHNETAVKLAEHWRQEAHRQAAFAQAAGAPAMQVGTAPKCAVTTQALQHLSLRTALSEYDPLREAGPNQG